MTIQKAKEIKKVLKKENAVGANAVYHNTNGELRVKVAQFLERSKFEGVEIERTTTSQKNKETQDNIVKVLRALTKNNLRPEYRTEQRNTSNCYGEYDTRYIIFN